jgi:hypothetical protein
MKTALNMSTTIPAMAAVCRVNNENHRISVYCGGKTAPVPDHGNNSPSGMFKWIHAAAIKQD